MRRLDFHVQRRLVIIPFAPRLPESSDLVVVQFPANQLFQLLVADFLHGFLLLGRLEPRLETRLHAYAERGVECDAVCVAADLGAATGLIDAEEEVARGLDREGGGVVGDWDQQERFFGRHGGCVCGEDAEFVAAEVPGAY
jgi:hypothetical protein